MTHRVLRLTSWLALALSGIAALAAVAVLVVGGLAYAGKATYPVRVDLGPLRATSDLSLPVTASGPVCQKGDTGAPNQPEGCFRFYLHDEASSGDAASSGIHTQDGSVRPTSASLRGEVALTSVGGGSRYALLSAIDLSFSLALVSVGFFLVRRLLAAAADPALSPTHVARPLRGIGWLLVAGPFALWAWTGLTKDLYDYDVVVLGAGPTMVPDEMPQLDLLPVAVGALLLVVAGVLRRSAGAGPEGPAPSADPQAGPPSSGAGAGPEGPAPSADPQAGPPSSEAPNEATSTSRPSEMSSATWSR
ncbi:hypothetical protein [Nocardioides daphniae]|uniref:DUF2975 domain-containing protein n=1 Tax=Nocardioides daphniae TaxID=402297 RepID=A0A4P7UBG5_9ACTN|nr:hypothetical protein [Nocardioides daphniae]QCC77316.1 hypothetical protein E2C04_09210 [Nocardioides daphniae]GGD25360.1 hypothetical protein GCM10007231_25860 [Nocardioides daphniae]